MADQWVALEHYRLHIIESWPESSVREAKLTAILCALRSFSCSALDPGTVTFKCSICLSRRGRSVVLEFPKNSGANAMRESLAA